MNEITTENIEVTRRAYTVVFACFASEKIHSYENFTQYY